MISQKVRSIEVSSFDRVNYNLWKKKITMFIKATNPFYMGIYENDSFISMKVVPESTVDGVRVTQRSIPKYSTESIDSENEIVTLDATSNLL